MSNTIIITALLCAIGVGFGLRGLYESQYTKQLEELCKAYKHEAHQAREAAQKMLLELEELENRYFKK